MTLLLLFNQPIPATEAASPLGVGGGATLSVDLWIADSTNALVTNITDSLVDGYVEYNADRAIKTAGSFKIRNPSQVTPYQDYLAPFIRLEYDDGTPTVYQQIGLFATRVPPGTRTIEDNVATFNGDDMTAVLASDAFTDAYNVASGANVGTAIAAIIATSGLTLVNLPTTTRTTSAIQSFPVGMTKLDACNKLGDLIGWLALGMDLDGKVSTPGPSMDLVQIQPYRTINNWDVLAPVDIQPTDSTIANVVVVVNSDAASAPLKSVARNDDASSPTSTVNVGRAIVRTETVTGKVTQADLDAKSRRLLSESRSFYRVCKLTIPHDPYSLVPHQTVNLNLSGEMAELSGAWWIRVARVSLTPAGATSLELNQISSNITGAVV